MRLMALLCLSLSGSLGTEPPEFLSFSAWQRSSQTPLSTAEELNQIGKKLNDHKLKLKSLKSRWTLYDGICGTLINLQDGENDKFFDPRYIQNLYNTHEKIFWEITYLKDEMRELKRIKNELSKGKIN